ncbi:MAG: HAD hydrolase family protein [Prevotellaceae bacterium]|nr:HAD hydrolase family protein [Prevotellaceae bacterium]MDY3855645.1 HAD hydrolase family protein [Bacteroidaceae bacterium]
MINYDLTKIRALLFDVDGVLSAPSIALGSDGQPVRTVNIKDGYALQLAIKRKLQVAIITGAKTEAVRERYIHLGISEVHLGCSVKSKVYADLCQRLSLRDDEIMYMGDDIPDYEVMKRCGLPCCPADAAPEIKAISRYVCTACGGMGCVREVIEQILRAQGKWQMDHVAFGW